MASIASTSPSNSPRRTLVVTGTSTGFGKLIAESAARAGWYVLASVRRDADRSALADCRADTGLLDLADPASIETFAARTLDWCGGHLDALVNNAGTAFPGPIEELDLDDLRRQFEVNVFGHIDLTQRLLPALRSARGRVVMMSSTNACISVPMLGAYSASKRALEGLAEALALEVAQFGVRVVNLEPGSFETAIWDTSLSRSDRYDSDDSPYIELARAVRAAAHKQPKGDAQLVADTTLALLEAENPPHVKVIPRAAAAEVLARRLLPNRVFFWLEHKIISRLGAGTV